VKGNVYSGNMPAFGGLLSDRDLGAVLTYVRQAWGNGAGPITEEQVAEARARYGDRASPWQAAELRDLAELETVAAVPETEEVGEAVQAQEEEAVEVESESGDGVEGSGEAPGPEGNPPAAI
jgi:hypothetical protein